MAAPTSAPRSPPTGSKSAPWFQTEESFALVDCDTSVIAPACELARVHEVLAAFMAVLDRCTLADLLKKQMKLLRLLGVEPSRVSSPNGAD